ncbi:acidic mammalian chitinase-like [Belonocnema kinseyi]|uniref:acidic mammalian chitinase-like n=1 Tax=Belonocnema kinseyi TaxID=2817044 RepID=UPI00143D3230|nr:acidic mammalian chitinase-like [Belonocnema kinseyi]
MFLQREKIVGCYYTVSLPSDDYFLLEVKDIDTSLCSHIYYNFASISANASIIINDPNAATEEGGLKQFNDLRKKNPMLKTLGTMECNEFTMTSADNINNAPLTDPKLRQKLVSNIVNYTKKYRFNGVDINYSDLPQHGGHPADKENFVLLLKALRERFDKENLILSVAVDPKEATAKILYDIKGISRYVNFINLKTFGFHGSSDADKKDGVGHNSPLYPSSKENAKERKKNIDYVVKYWISQGAPRGKLILGTASHGTSYTLANPKKFGRGAPFTKEGKFGNQMTYFSFCYMIKTWNYFYDPEQQVPYIHKGHETITYDDVRSIKAKAKYVQDMHLGGAMLYKIDHDDYRGDCGEKFPLLKTLNQVLRNEC